MAASQEATQEALFTRFANGSNYCHNAEDFRACTIYVTHSSPHLAILEFPSGTRSRWGSRMLTKAPGRFIPAFKHIHIGHANSLCPRRRSNARQATPESAAVLSMTIDIDALRARCEQAGQAHILEDWDQISPSEREQLTADVQVGWG